MESDFPNNVFPTWAIHSCIFTGFAPPEGGVVPTLTPAAAAGN